jgi:hypothetical protein
VAGPAQIPGLARAAAEAATGSESTRRGVPGWTRRGVESAQAGIPTSGRPAGSAQAGELQSGEGHDRDGLTSVTAMPRGHHIGMP